MWEGGEKLEWGEIPEDMCEGVYIYICVCACFLVVPVFFKVLLSASAEGIGWQPTMSSLALRTVPFVVWVVRYVLMRSGG